MSFIITPSELDDLTESELQALHARILSDLRRASRFLPECPHIHASLRNVEAALVRIQQRPLNRSPKGPGL